MVKKFFSALAVVALLLLVGCGGGGSGGGGGSTSIVGRVINVVTGAAPNPASSVQVGSSSVLTSTVDGSFTLGVPSGTSAASVDTQGSGFGVWNFSFPPASGVSDIGDLWVGPQQVTVTGIVRNSTNNAPVQGSLVSFAGRRGSTGVDGRFTLTNVAYANSTQAAFWGIVGKVQTTGFFATDWSALGHLANSGVVDVGDILITPLSDPNPPGTPFNIWGQITVAGGPSGTIVRLRQGTTDIRVFNVGSDGRYLFFVSPGSYTINATKGTLTAPDQSVTLTQPNEVIRRDFTLN